MLSPGVEEGFAGRTDDLSDERNLIVLRDFLVLGTTLLPSSLIKLKIEVSFSMLL